MLGVVTLALAIYYVTAARNGLVAFFRATVPVRAVVVAAFVGLVAVGAAPWQLVLFGLIDAAGAVWTAMALLEA